MKYILVFIIIILSVVPVLAKQADVVIVYSHNTNANLENCK